MEAKKAYNLINKILKEERFTEVATFISLLCYRFIKLYDMPEREFLKHLKNSLKIIEKDLKNAEEK